MYRPRSFACITALAAAVASAALALRLPPHGVAARPPPCLRRVRPGVGLPRRPPPSAAPPRIVVTPDAIRLPGQPRRAPLTTEQCEETEAIACYSPDQIRAAYHLPALYARGITGAGETIVIVDSFGSPTITSDLATFDKKFGYPAPPDVLDHHAGRQDPRLRPEQQQHDQLGGGDHARRGVRARARAGRVHPAGRDADLRERGHQRFPQIVTAEEYVINHGLGAVISQSFSATEETFASYAQIEPLRAAFLDADSHHVTVLAASGDEGATDYTANGSDFYTRRVTSWPDSDPLVTGVGGTQLLESGGAYTSVAWNDTDDQASDEYWGGSTDPDPLASGGGTSEYFARPSYQDGVKAVTGASRGVPDIAMSAACDGAVNVYSSFANGPRAGR